MQATITYLLTEQASSKRVERMGRCPEGTRMSRWFTGRFYGMTPLRANLRTANTISWKVKLILHYCGLWQHQRHTCGNCNNAVTTDGD